MDFSLLQAKARNRFLRDITALKRTWIYYPIMVIDPILRFSWIFYAIFAHNTQHSTAVSFFVSLAEVTRRGMWTLLRVENEHCGNVAQYKASRDTPLPYHLEVSASQTGLEQSSGETPAAAEQGPNTPGSLATSMGTARTPGGPGSVRLVTGAERPGGAAAGSRPDDGGSTFHRRRSSTAGKRSILQAMAEAHKQDFEKRKPVEEAKDRELAEEEEERSEEDDDDGTVSEDEERMRIREAESLVKDDQNGGYSA